MFDEALLSKVYLENEKDMAKTVEALKLVLQSNRLRKSDKLNVRSNLFRLAFNATLITIQFVFYFFTFFLLGVILNILVCNCQLFKDFCDPNITVENKIWNVVWKRLADRLKDIMNTTYKCGKKCCQLLQTCGGKLLYVLMLLVVGLIVGSLSLAMSIVICSNVLLIGTFYESLRNVKDKKWDLFLTILILFMLAILLHLYPFTNLAIFPLMLLYCFCFAKSNDENIVFAACGAIGCSKYKGRKEKVLSYDTGKDGDDEIEKDVYANYIEKYQDIEPHIVKMAYDVHMGVEEYGDWHEPRSILAHYPSIHFFYIRLTFTFLLYCFGGNSNCLLIIL